MAMGEVGTLELAPFLYTVLLYVMLSRRRGSGGGESERIAGVLPLAVLAVAAYRNIHSEQRRQLAVLGFVAAATADFFAAVPLEEVPARLFSFAASSVAHLCFIPLLYKVPSLSCSVLGRA